MGKKLNVIIELTSYTMAMAVGFGEDSSAVHVEGVKLDQDFNVIMPPEASHGMEFNFAQAAASTVLVRGEIDEEDLLKGDIQAKNNTVVGVYADPTIESMLPTCANSPAIGSDADVARLLGADQLIQAGVDGNNILLAIVDTGINSKHIQSRGKNIKIDAARSWAHPKSNFGPAGSRPVGHGTMCAYDALIAAPNCTVLDIAVLRPQKLQTLLSDAVMAYAHLLTIARKLPDEGFKALVVSNSWGMYNPSSDLPVGNPGNYSHNPNHPFNRIVGTLENAGADILFAAGNCGRDCPDPRCQGVTNYGITGANSHGQVLCVGGVDTNKQRVGYSSTGPGCLSSMKPDLMSYTHFDGSNVFNGPDTGTSAATPVAAGTIAALRSKFPYNPSDPATSPASIRNFFCKTALDAGVIGFDFDYGWGIIDAHQLLTMSSLRI